MAGTKQWLTVSEACQALGMTERTIRRYIKQGKYESKLSDGRRLVCVQPHDSGQAPDMQTAMTPLKDEIAFLHTELQARNRQIEKMGEELAESRQRSDTIILQVTSQLDRAYLQIEDMRRRRTVWQRLRAVFIAQETV